MIQFPQNFLWGAATSSYQVEGNNDKADWWAWEKQAGKEPSGQACRHYEMYKQDFDLAQGLGHKAHRLSIEWSRVEPQPGQFSQQELQHYLDVITALKARGLEPIVTLHHFTNPQWFSQAGAWSRRENIDRFARFAEQVVIALAGHVRFWVTINEPTIYVSQGYILGAWPPQAKSFGTAMAVHEHMMAAHRRVYALIHKIYRKAGLASPSVGIAHHMAAVESGSNSIKDRWTARWRDYWYNFKTLDSIKDAMDFIGLNYYSRHLVGAMPPGPPLAKNSLGWDIYPQGLYQVLLKLKRYARPVVITENGICTCDDDLRWTFIREHLAQAHAALQQGVALQGYLYWSLLDNFEWDKGFAPRFGLVDINYKTFQRTVRPSAVKFAEVCHTGKLSI